MSWQDLMIDGFGRIQEILEHVFEGMSPEIIDTLPKADCNPIGWLGWHLIRVQDAQMADLMGEEQLWTRDGWHEKFHRPADPEDSGFGDTPEKVAAFKSPEMKVVIDYSQATVERSQAYLKTLSENRGLHSYLCRMACGRTIIAATRAPTIPPANPSTVFPGLMAGQSLCLPIRVPV